MNAIQVGQAIVGLFVLFKLVSVPCILSVMFVAGLYVALFIDVTLLRLESFAVLMIVLMVGTICWFAVRSEKARNKGM